jgi:tetratricopeptide (TPR) repeat protein
MYRQLLATDPQDAMVLNLLGAVCINLQRLEEAREYLVESLRLNRNFAAAHDNLGVVLVSQNQIPRAIASFREAVTFDPKNVQTQMNLFSALVRGGQPVEAIEVLRRVVQLAPDNARAHGELARLFVGQDRGADSIPHFRKVVLLQRDDPRAHFELADALARIGQKTESIALYLETMRLNPNSAETCVNLSYLYIDQKSLDEALRWSRRAVELRPRFAEAYHNLGCALTKLEKYDEAIAALQQAASLKPEMPETYNNIGTVLAEQGQYAAAIESYRRAVALRTENPDAIYNMATAFLKLGDLPAALEHFDRAIALRPEYAEARHNRSATWLLEGDFARGLGEYEWRLRSRDYPGITLRWKVWSGEPLAGRTIVLTPEQGLGDTLQFVRFAPLVKQLGARVLLECPPGFRPILARTPGIDGFIGPDAVAGDADCCVPLLSVPYRLETRLECVPAEVPYVFADPDLIASWRRKLGEIKGFRVGIAWQGNPKCPGDRTRSIPLARYASLAKVPGVRLVNLQKGPGAEQLKEFGEAWSIVDLGDEVDQAAGGSFMDTAAIMKNLDLVITSDTATAHLAGALGVDVWVALQKIPDWRWLLDREDCPWYPTMRLFRQTTFGDWAEVFERMAGQLARLVAETS